MARSRWIVNFVTSLLPFSGSAVSFAQAANPPANRFPQTVEVIPGTLRARIFLHEIQDGPNKISCWTYVSDGLWAHKQKEIMFTVQRREGERAEDYPTGVFGLFATVYHYAEKGELVDAGGASMLGQSEFLGRKDIRGVGYTEPQPLPGVDAGNGPFLTAIMLKGDEARIAWDFGLARVTARLGQEYRYYPFPPWADLDREPVITSAEMDKSVVAKQKIRSVDVQASFYLENGNIFIRVPGDSKAAADLQNHILERPASEPLMFRGHVDPRAGACLVWVVGSKNPNAISAPGSDGSRTTGAFLIMVMDRKAEANRVQLIEDGAALYLTSPAWQKMREAMASGNNLVVPAAAKGEPNITLDWVKTSYSSPITGEKVVSQGFESYHPTTPLARNTDEPISDARVTLMTSDADLKAHTSVDDLVAYLKAMDKVVNEFFAVPARRTSRDLTIEMELNAEGHRVQFVAKPELSREEAAGFLDRLNHAPAPRVTGPVKLDYSLKLWSTVPIS